MERSGSHILSLIAFSNIIRTQQRNVLLLAVHLVLTAGHGHGSSDAGGDVVGPPVLHHGLGLSEESESRLTVEVTRAEVRGLGASEGGEGGGHGDGQVHADLTGLALHGVPKTK